MLFEHKLINVLYGIIDELIAEFKYPSSYRYLIIGDFLFAFQCNDRSDPANIIFKASRSDYIRSIELRASINNNLGIDKQQYILFHKKLLIGLRISNILKKNTNQNG